MATLPRAKAQCAKASGVTPSLSVIFTPTDNPDRGNSKNFVRHSPVRAKLRFTYQGETLTLHEWSARLDLTYQQLYNRWVRRGHFDLPRPYEKHWEPVSALVLDILGSRSKPTNSPTLYDRVVDSYGPLNKRTFYRLMCKMVQDKLVKRIEYGDNPSHGYAFQKQEV